MRDAHDESSASIQLLAAVHRLSCHDLFAIAASFLAT
jgi:hypothetical protein